ncbi:hypothetical protein [Pseudooceanicola nitratireducens]|uniref:hypothetical protein n=1 Tax=Pseudooceanicola nitratireducens TaxID=517719 RepID=UPI001C93D69B|nr:hypothetical protein [Pseudooceanicola nitratireducens]MBY6157466.1 hypothetical protein [Pseudooceanicola nitratireducens]
MSDIHSAPSFARQKLAGLLKGASPRWQWWLALGVCLGGIIWAVQIYENSRSFFLRRPDAGATIQAVLMAMVSIGFFAVMTLRRANALSFGPKMRWTLLLPPLWLIWFPALGLVKSLSSEDVKRLGRRTSRFAIVGGAASAAALAVFWWLGADVIGTRDTAGARTEIINGSDDLATQRDRFLKAASTLIKDGRCSEADFREMGGWLKSTSKGEGIYFTYCGGMTLQHRLYLDTKTGRIFR